MPASEERDDPKRWRNSLGAVAAGLLACVLSACGGGGSGGGGGAAAPAGPGQGNIDVAALQAATALNITITGATVNSPPVVNFIVTNEAGVGMAGLTPADLQFNIAKLSPGVNGEPTTWQNYINTAAGGAVQGSQERLAAGFAFGSLVNNANGNYTYIFATDIRNPAANPCPVPCTDAAGKALDLSFQPGTTHRVTIQQGNTAYVNATGVFDFVPAGGAGVGRNIVATAKCNQCHAQITGHGNRVDTKLCVTCHNPGSWVAGAPATTVDFKVMIHKIHYAPNLPSVLAGTPYVVSGRDFSGVLFPQDVRNCTLCHDATPGATNTTPQGDNWKNRPNMDACGACHDDVFFGANPNPGIPFQNLPHPGGVMTDNSTCQLCHGAGRFTDAKDIVVAHSFPARLKAAAAKFKYNIISVAPSTPGSTPVITFSVTDPTNGDAAYDIKTAAAFTAPVSTLALDLGWTTTGFADIGNDSTGHPFGQPVSVNLLGNAAVTPGPAPGTFQVTSPIAIPLTVTPPVPVPPTPPFGQQVGTLRAVLEGHPAGDVTTAGTFADKLPVTSAFKDFAVTGPVVPRRLVVHIAKCDVCHAVLSLHDSSRTEEPGVCVVCHNPNATDFAQRPAAARPEESIDLKRMIHGIHAGQLGKGGFRITGITIYRADGTPHDFSNVVFPGVLNDCSTCHIGTSYQLTTPFWDAPAANGILGSTISTPTASPADNLRITPIAAVCSSCHDSAVARAHITDAFNAGNFSATQAQIIAAPEACAFCHGPGKAIDVQLVHHVK
jgi:OmcA/MtrC family decaheme c-type cytochrome